MVITPTYWKRPLAAADTSAIATGSVASRSERSKQRQLSVSLGDLSSGDLLHLNKLKGRKKNLIFGKVMQACPLTYATTDTSADHGFAGRNMLVQSAIHSWGLYAAEPIEKEEFVVEYLGEYVRAAVAEVRFSIECCMHMSIGPSVATE